MKKDCFLGGQARNEKAKKYSAREKEFADESYMTKGEGKINHEEQTQKWPRTKNNIRGPQNQEKIESCLPVSVKHF